MLMKHKVASVFPAGLLLPTVVPGVMVCVCILHTCPVTDRRVIVSEANLGYVQQATVSEKNYY